jgi:hypothetical protein
MQYGRPNYRSPAWPESRPKQANYRCLGLAELASAVNAGTPHRSSGRVALHVLEAMYGILDAAASGHPVTIATQIERPAVLTDEVARALARPGASI